MDGRLTDRGPESHRSPGAQRFRRIALRIAGAYLALLAALWLGISRWSSLPPAGPGLSDEERAVVFRALRAVVDGRSPPPDAGLHASTNGSPPPGGWSGRVTVYCAGRPHAVVPVEWRVGSGLVGLQELAADPAIASLPPGARASCRIQLDRFTTSAPIAWFVEPLLALSLVPGLDGIGLHFGEREARLTAQDLVAADLLSGYHLLPEAELEAGLATRDVITRLALAAGADRASWGRTPRRLFRFRTESFIEAATPSPAPATLRLTRGNPPAPPLDRTVLRERALLGARYLRDHLHPDGRFGYRYDPVADQELPDRDDYSLPRHAGAAWFLAQAAGVSSDPSLQEAARRAIRYLVEKRPDGCDRPEWACVARPGDVEVDLGSSALALLAAVEYERATGDATFAPWARRLAAFLLQMQKPSGDFCHLFDLATLARDERTRLLYYSGEAAFALSKLARLERDRAAVPSESRSPLGGLDRAVDRALAYLTVDNYAFFAGGFFYGEDHWTCMAVDEAWDLVPGGREREGYGDFCEGFARFLGRSQLRAGDGPLREQPDLEGAYTFSPLLAPHTTPVGSRSEALLSILRVAERRGHHDQAEAIRASLRAGLRFLAGRQVSLDGAFRMPRPEAAIGGFPASDVKPIIRIDFVQHAGSAMLRASERGDVY